jgi:hypothetical protein
MSKNHSCLVVSEVVTLSTWVSLSSWCSAIKHEENLSTSSLAGTCVFYTNGCCKIGRIFTIGHVETWDDEEAFIKPQYHCGQMDRMGSLRRWRNFRATAISLWWEKTSLYLYNLILSGWWYLVKHEWKFPNTHRGQFLQWWHGWVTAPIWQGKHADLARNFCLYRTNMGCMA